MSHPHLTLYWQEVQDAQAEDRSARGSPGRAQRGHVPPGLQVGLLIFGFYFTSKILLVKVHLLVNRNNIVKKTSSEKKCEV